MRVFIHDKVFGRRIFVSSGEKPAALLNAIARAGYDTDGLDDRIALAEDADGRFIGHGSLGVIVLRSLRRGNARDVAVLAHEAAHAAVWLFDSIEEEVCPQHDEPFAYFVGFIVRETLEGAW